MKASLLRVLKAENYDIAICGMVGIQYICDALALCEASDVAFRMVSKGRGYRTWYELGATTLWECWDGEKLYSHNHHMFSNVIAWFYKSLLGIEPILSHPGFEKIDLHPQFVEGLDFCSGEEETVRGTIRVEWKREGNAVLYTAEIPTDITATLLGEPLSSGVNRYRFSDGSMTRLAD